MEQPSGSSSETSFNFAELCFFCGNKKNRYRTKVVAVPNDDESRRRLLDICARTTTDEGEAVKKRLESVPSLVTAKAEYHLNCYHHFSRVLHPEKYDKLDPEYKAALQKVFQHIIDSNKKQFTLLELQTIMEHNFRSNETLFTALKNHFGSDISIVQAKGKQPQFLYKKPEIFSICTDWHYTKDYVSEASKQTILKVAAGILTSEIKDVKYNHSSYPPSSKFLDNVTNDIPPLLAFFLDTLMDIENNPQHEVNMLKRNSIAHSLISVLKSKSFISTLHLAVGTYIYRKTGSRLIIDMLSKLGVSSTYKAVQLYEASTIMNPATFYSKNSFVQFVFDNTDHNVSTLDGKETFHCLGGIAIYTPRHNVSYEGSTEKLNKMPSASDLAQQKQIRTIPYRPISKPRLDKIKYVSVSSMNLSSPPLIQKHYCAYLWAKYLEVPDVPSWGGFMDVITSDMDYSVSHIACLPFINEPPSNLTTLNTSLNYALEECAKKKQQTCFVTYDQPLYLKARSIALQGRDSNFKNVVVRLGGFHLLMSYLGAIGYIMGGSGLEDLWCTIYAAQSTKKMISGHAYSRAVRAHILTFTALGMIICNAINSKKEQNKDDNQDGQRKFEKYTEITNNIKSTFANWSTAPPLLHELKNDENIKILSEEFTTYLKTISKENPTAQLWVQYFESVSVALQFIEAERLGNWKLHLQSIKKMLPLFHASGHFAYAKSAQIYLQDMLQLEDDMNEEEYERFTNEGYFTIRRSCKAWSGIWTDMTIEQTLNRFFGTDLKHGRGVTASVVARYLLGMPAAFNVMDNLENFLNLKSANSEQHTDLSPSRIKKDASDIEILKLWLQDHSPFQPWQNLVSVSLGIIGNKDTNCNRAYEVGEQGMATMVNQNAEFSLTKVYKVQTLLNAKSLHVVDIPITIDPLMLFQRISLVIHGDEKKMREAFEYELSPYPLSFFNEEGIMRKTNKAQLYKIFDKHDKTDNLLRNSSIIIDGGWLLHQVVWPHSRTFAEIFELYYSFITNHYGTNVTVIFDGYANDIMGVKSYERYRRKERNVPAEICIMEDSAPTLTQTKFLSNVGNKLKLVQKLLFYLRNKEIRTEVAAEDADCLIVNEALQISESSPATPVIIIGNDVDLLILLIALAPDNKPCYFFKIAGGKSINTLYSSADYSKYKPIILFIHAFSGCDSTSAFYRKGKKSIINIFESDSELKNEIKEFYKPNNTIDNLYPVAEKIVCAMYSKQKKKKTEMKNLRYDCFKTSVTSAKKDISLAMLPPTKPALIEHVKRVYYQIQLWLGKNLEPEEWGWRKTETMLIPILNTDKPAPENLLNLIHCGCTGNCSTRQCTCQKMGLKCNQLCRNCNGESCMNRQIIKINDGSDEDTDEGEDEEITGNDGNKDDDEDDDEYDDENDDQDKEKTDDRMDVDDDSINS